MYSNKRNISDKVRTFIRNFLPERRFPKDLLCASNTQVNLKSSCVGNSGSPLTKGKWSKKRGQEIFTLMGSVVGSVEKCGSNEFPTVYIRLRDCNILSFVNSVTKITPICKH